LVVLLEIADLATAALVHRVQCAAYRQEADLLGVESLPALTRGVEDLQHLGETFAGIYLQGDLAAACSFEDVDPFEICSLVVHPSFQRRGLGAALLRWLLSQSSQRCVAVSTGARNVPALALYAQFGFVEVRRSFFTDPPLEVVHLERPASESQLTPQ
jgi:ribosomal protein S18 acetylase RimI-like enzyme